MAVMVYYFKKFGLQNMKNLKNICHNALGTMESVFAILYIIMYSTVSLG